MATLKAAHIRVYGVVQGVGFRPFVYKLASAYKLKGCVYNTSEDVRIDVEGEEASIGQFYRELKSQAPPLARIERTTIQYQPPSNCQHFEIRHSTSDKQKFQLVSPDITTCQDCLKEFFDPDDRRYRYPFTNCTNCGPRFTIIEEMPYDREKTTMRKFQMCSLCKEEYSDPGNRRFHAQPNACPECGPQVELADASGAHISTPDTMRHTSHLLQEGKIVAIKGLGGFLLACDATSEATIRKLRQRKNRPFKPLAVMIPSITEVKEHCSLSEEEEKLLLSPQSPIVLLKWNREHSSISSLTAPEQEYLGVMLPYTPLHHILLKDTGLPLIMTSGNISEEPIARDNDEAVTHLKGIADYFLLHDRDIYARYDDSVVTVEQKHFQIIRRSRGYAPFPLPLPFSCRQILACGAQMKNTFCLTRGHHAFLSQHIGDMENLETMDHFSNTISLYENLFHIRPEIIAHDLHPDYPSTGYALEREISGLKRIPVQHHHAHVASCMADNGIESPVIGVVFDRTGLGADGNISGGEFLEADYQNCTRKGHLEYLPLPGGDMATKKPYRIAVAYLFSLLGEDALKISAAVDGINKIELDILKQQITKKLNTPLTSSMGRLFDAVSALLGIRNQSYYEGQAAVELEMAAHRDSTNEENYPYHITREKEMKIIQISGLLTAILDDMKRDVPVTRIAASFHDTIARMTDEMCCLIARESGIEQVALSGGVFQNRLLLNKTTRLLKESGFQVILHRQCPCNDGGISLGQAVIANFAEEP